MLKLKGITKKYETGAFKQTALDHIDLSFRKNEFVAVLGPSGSGKTTLLNMIGGLDRYDQGDLLIDGKSTKTFKDQDWDSYRNHSIGFVFQNYNLITHTSVLANVEVAMTLSGMTSEQRRARALEVLEEVGLKDHVHKKPNQLSGGQMQRVAIARALSNDPDIILADEPTGAIDSETSKQIMSIIERISKDKLVIMVTHDERIAKTYANRIVSLADGRVIDDSNPYESKLLEGARLKLKKTSMAFGQALKLSFSNLKTKKFRTLITAFAGSIGIIGIALVLSLANGLDKEIERLEVTTLAEFPIQIDTVAINIEAASRGQAPERIDADLWDPYPEDPEIYAYEQVLLEIQHFNDISEDYIRHVESLAPDLYYEISYRRSVNMNVIFDQGENDYTRLNNNRVRFEPMIGEKDFFNASYDILSGDLPENKNELLLVIDEYNRLNLEMLTALGLPPDVETLAFDDVIGRKFKVIDLDDYYLYDDVEDRFYPNSDFTSLAQDAAGIDLSIVGIARVKSDGLSAIMDQGIKYHPDLVTSYLESARSSRIGQAQLESDISVITNEPQTPSEIASLLRSLGVDPTPSQIRIYPVDFAAKQAITEHLDQFNQDLDEDMKIVYTDIASIVTDLTSDVIDGISYVLIAFSSISLIVSSIMIGIITYVSVLERTKEIGLLRSMGARKKDISRVFNAETTIIGLTAGILGVAAAYILTFPINYIIASLVEDINALAVLPIEAVFGLIVISILLTYIAGLIPARIAANKDPVIALRID